jgi:sugar/nucleoside kinase (ribokinase family)
LVGEDDLDWGLVSKARILHWGGPALTPGLDGEPIGRVFKRARELGVMTSIDTIYDGAGIWFPHIEHALPHTDIIMSSLEEARRYTGQQAPDDIADFYLKFGPKIALVKLGADGLLVKSGSERHYIQGHAVEVVDSTGAGDAACGGFLYGVLNDWGLKRSAQLANAVGAMTVQAMGGAGAVIRLAAAEAMMEGVQ